MPESAVAQRYAEALYELASSEGIEDRIGADLALIGRLWRAIPELSPFLTHPLIPAEEKERLLTQALRDSLHPYTLNLLRLLVRKKRAGLLPEIESAFLKAAEEHGKLVHILIRTARPIPENELQRLKVRLEEVLKKPVALTVEEVPELLAGAELVVGGRRLDASLRGRLARLAASLRG